MIMLRKILLFLCEAGHFIAPGLIGGERKVRTPQEGIAVNSRHPEDSG